MAILITSLLLSLAFNLLVVASAGRHGRLFHDHDMTGPQKFHARPVPRIGGAGIIAAMVGATGISALGEPSQASEIWLLIACSLPAFLMGFTEDLTKSISPRRRLVATVASVALAIWLLDAVIVRTAIPGIDLLMPLTGFAIALTLFVVTGVANAVNIIDGFNGLASMCVLLMTLGICYVAFQVGDQFVFTATLIVAGAVLGFFIWNFPAGLIFLGDGGAYLLGFMVAELAVLLLKRNPSVSPMFALLLCSYPIFETIFTIYRRKFVRGTATAQPDAIHLHTLIHRRVVRWLVGESEERRKTVRNSLTSPYLWLLCLTSVIPSVLWWDNTAVLTVCLVAFMIGYVLLYRSIVRFKTPKWLLVLRR